jgi:hypothetical protein
MSQRSTRERRRLALRHAGRAQGAGENGAVKSANWWHELMTGWRSRIESDGTQVWELRKAGHVATLLVRKEVSGVELLLTVDGELVRSRQFSPEQQDDLAADLANALGTTRESFEAKGWTA